MRLRLLPCVLLALALLAPAARASTGPYLDFAQRPEFVDGSTVFIGPLKVPQVRSNYGIHDNPVTVSHWALQHWSRWLHTRAEADRRPLVTAARWLVRWQRADGAWAYRFTAKPGGLVMHPPWVSAMTQGMGISVLVRAYAATCRPGYLRRARLALLPLTRPVTSLAGVTSTWRGAPWYEEYPSSTSSQHVLNGFEFTLLGLHDLEGRSPLARRLWRTGVRVLARRISLFDLPHERTQLYAAVGRGRWRSNSAYRHEHAILTRELARLTGDSTLRHWARRWGAWDTVSYGSQPRTRVRLKKCTGEKAGHVLRVGAKWPVSSHSQP